MCACDCGACKATKHILFELHPCCTFILHSWLLFIERPPDHTRRRIVLLAKESLVCALPHNSIIIIAIIAAVVINNIIVCWRGQYVGHHSTEHVMYTTVYTNVIYIYVYGVNNILSVCGLWELERVHYYCQRLHTATIPRLLQNVPTQLVRWGALSATLTHRTHSFT